MTRLASKYLDKSQLNLETVPRINHRLSPFFTEEKPKKMANEKLNWFDF